MNWFGVKPATMSDSFERQLLVSRPRLDKGAKYTLENRKREEEKNGKKYIVV